MAWFDLSACLWKKCQISVLLLAMISPTLVAVSHSWMCGSNIYFDDVLAAADGELGANDIYNWHLDRLQKECRKQETNNKPVLGHSRRQMEIFRSRSRPKQKLNNCFDANINNAMHMQNQHTITLTPAPLEIKPGLPLNLEDQSSFPARYKN